ncbi:MAG: 16S rRNA (adenine(1518)-N(6)/adenine(1519)-N(6))-dimethyltransferase RsmA [Candidatus Poribacteria bacterium]|nr:16S rRNA (adenine(1518)-N(6)/adenine(1519)-N(6))-dimethyltransferase RsmA [Candidatus Poribacteria bacterium]
MNENKAHHERMTLLQQAKAFLKTHRTRPKKQLGQHFLINPDVLSIIIEAGGVTDTDVVIEIGAGLGCLTAALAERAKSVIAIEVDPLLYAELESQFSTDTDIQIVHADVLELEFSSLFPPNTCPKVIANLPYGITTPILSKLLEHTNQLSTCVLMMQREVAERIVAPPGGKDYGALTIGVSYYADTALVGILSPQNFFPAPQVDSALLKLTMREKPQVTVNDEDYFFRVVREAFRGRRKMLKNSLRRFASAEILNEAFAELSIAPQRRAETLDITEFAALANLLQTNV